MNTVLDDAEARIAPAATTVHATQHEIIAAMRLEIRPERYERAKTELPKLEHYIGKDIRPFMERLASIGKRAKTPLPPHIHDHLNEMTKLCDGVPHTVREGIKQWDQLTPPLDDRERSKKIHDITVLLINFDGARERLESLRGQVEHYITTSGWPALPPPAAA